jgi:hypothetical protein
MERRNMVSHQGAATGASSLSGHKGIKSSRRDRWRRGYGGRVNDVW